MSRSSSTTIVQVVQNQNIFINQVNNAGGSIGMGPVAPGTAISTAAQQYSTFLQQKLGTSFQTVFSTALPSENQDNGYMGPIQALDPHNPPQCVIDQVNQDMSNWNLPMTTDIAQRIASTIVLHLSTEGGASNFASGTLQVTSNESICWMAYYGTFDIEQNEQGAVYAFGAALQFA